MAKLNEGGMEGEGGQLSTSGGVASTTESWERLHSTLLRLWFANVPTTHRTAFVLLPTPVEHDNMKPSYCRAVIFLFPHRGGFCAVMSSSFVPFLYKNSSFFAFTREKKLLLLHFLRCFPATWVELDNKEENIKGAASCEKNEQRKIYSISMEDGAWGMVGWMEMFRLLVVKIVLRV